jgi:hypothetical protein
VGRGRQVSQASRPRNKAATKSLADDIERIMQTQSGGLADSERWI